MIDYSVYAINNYDFFVETLFRKEKLKVFLVKEYKNQSYLAVLDFDIQTFRDHNFLTLEEEKNNYQIRYVKGSFRPLDEKQETVHTFRISELGIDRFTKEKSRCFLSLSDAKKYLEQIK